MGKEANCVAKINGKRHTGKALLETTELLFRAGDLRIKIALADMRAVTASDGQLHFKWNGASFSFAIGAAAEKWRDKILHPKSRAEKLGLKPGTALAVLGDADPAFLQEAARAKAIVIGGGRLRDAGLIFLTVHAKPALKQVAGLARAMPSSAALWIIYPKGKKELSESHVIEAGRTSGLKDVKVVGFSATHTALKFVVPLNRR